VAALDINCSRTSTIPALVRLALDVWSGRIASLRVG
jgi:hypothetical protein